MTMTPIDPRTARIRALNDMLRMTLRGGKIMFAGELAHQDPTFQMIVLMEVATFTDFNEDNDPYGEHDFVKVEVGGEPYFGKIDYYDLDLEYGSPDPADPAVTTRVLTIFHARDY